MGWYETKLKIGGETKAVMVKTIAGVPVRIEGVPTLEGTVTLPEGTFEVIQTRVNGDAEIRPVEKKNGK